MKKTVEKNTVQNKSISAPSSGVTKKGQKSRSAVSFGDRPLYVDVIPGGSLGTLWFEDVLGKFERKVMKINEDYVNMDINMSKVASKLCDAYHKTFGDYEFADDDQAQDVTRLIRYHTVYYKMDKSHKKLLDDVFPEISSGFHRTTTRKTTTRPQIPSPISSCGTFGRSKLSATSGFAT